MIVLAPLVLLGGVTAVLFGLARLQRGNQTDSSAADTPNITEEEAQAAAGTITGNFPDAEVSVVSGGQPVYYYMIAVE